MKYVAFIFLIIVACGRNGPIEIDADFFVQRETVSGDYVLRYQKEAVLPHHNIHEIGYNQEYIIANTSAHGNSGEIKSEEYYIINKNEYIRLHGKKPGGGVSGPYDSDMFNKMVSELDHNSTLKFTKQFYE